MPAKERWREGKGAACQAVGVVARGMVVDGPAMGRGLGGQL